MIFLLSLRSFYDYPYLLLLPGAPGVCLMGVYFACVCVCGVRLVGALGGGSVARVTTLV